MNLKESIESCLRQRNWKPSRLARESGVKLNSITRVLNGERQGVHSRNMEKLMPFFLALALPNDDGGRIGKAG